MKKLIIAVVLLMSASLLSAQSGASIMKTVRDSQSFATAVMELKMTLVEKNGSTSSRTIQTLTAKNNGLTNTVTLFLSPASVKNTRFLSIENKGRDDDQWIYLPSINKVKRIATTEKSGSFMGSDFSYSDMASTNADPEEGTHTLLREENFNGVLCYVVESLPLPGSSEYGKTTSWVSKTNSVVMKVDFYAADKKTVVKSLQSENVQQLQGHWMARKMTMTSSSGHKTIIEITQAKFDITVDPGYFTEYFLETGRSK